MKRYFLLAMVLGMFGCEEYGLEDYDLLLEDSRYELISEHEGTNAVSYTHLRAHET